MGKHDMAITVGHLVENPTFDACFKYRIVTVDENECYKTLFAGFTGDDHPPAELLVKPVEYITMDEDTLVIEPKMCEE